MPSFRLLSLATTAAVLAFSPGARAQFAPGGSRFDAERAFQSYLSFWSSDADINAGAVSRFYAPRVSYYGKAWTRPEVLADKRAFIRHWPVRSYREVPGSLKASCDAGRTRCHITAEMDWRRAGSGGAAEAGRARLKFDFVLAEGAFKIARESARIL